MVLFAGTGQAGPQQRYRLLAEALGHGLRWRSRDKATMAAAWCLTRQALATYACRPPTVRLVPLRSIR